MMFNDAGLKLIMEFEGFSANAYQDQGGKWTIGYGSTQGVTPGMAVTVDEASQMLLASISEVETAMKGMIKTALTDNQYSALVCFAYNVGCGNLASSTLLERVNSDDPTASDQFLRWDHITVNGVQTESPGLLRRRQAEQALFNNPTA